MATVSFFWAKKRTALVLATARLMITYCHYRVGTRLHAFFCQEGDRAELKITNEQSRMFELLRRACNIAKSSPWSSPFGKHESARFRKLSRPLKESHAEWVAQKVKITKYMWQMRAVARHFNFNFCSPVTIQNATFQRSDWEINCCALKEASSISKSPKQRFQQDKLFFLIFHRLWTENVD